MPSNNEPEKKSKLHFFGKRDKHRDNGASTSQPTDSGYATSENQSQLNPSSEVTATTTHSEPQTTINNPSHSENRDLVVDQPSGNVIDRDTGDVVTTVTTTTTTTTTTSSNRNGERHVKTEPVNVEKQKRYDELNNAQRDSGFGSASQLNHSNSTGLRDGIYDNNSSNRNSALTDSTMGIGNSNRNEDDLTSATINPAHESANLTTTHPGARPGESPPVPARSAMRESSRNRDIAPSATGGMDMTPPQSPTKHNFSYPTRQPPNSMPSYQAANEKIPVVDEPVRTTNKTGTLANLKVAATGLHVCPTRP